MIADHPSEFKPVELRHADIAQNDSDVLLEKMLERLPGGPGFDQVFSEALQCRLIAEELCRLIVDKQNVDRILGHDTPYRESHNLRVVKSCSVLTGLAR